MKNVNAGIVGRLRVPAPPLSEQHAIVELANQVNTKIGKASICIQRQLEHVEEFRGRLMGDVVTGKLDVGAAAGTVTASEIDNEHTDGDSRPAGVTSTHQHELNRVN